MLCQNIYLKYRNRIEDKSCWNVYQLKQATRDFQRTLNTAQSRFHDKWPAKADRFDKYMQHTLTLYLVITKQSITPPHTNEHHFFMAGISANIITLFWFQPNERVDSITKEPRDTLNSVCTVNCRAHHAFRTNILSRFSFLYSLRSRALLGLIAFVICLMAALGRIAVTWQCTRPRSAWCRRP